MKKGPEFRFDGRMMGALLVGLGVAAAQMAFDKRRPDPEREARERAKRAERRVARAREDAENRRPHDIHYNRSRVMHRA